MTLDQAAAVILSLIDAQKGYGDSPSTPERIINLREVIKNLDAAMEDALSNLPE